MLCDFSTGSEVVRALREFIHARYLKNTDFAAKEIEMLDSDQIPSVMEKVWGTLDKAKDALAASGAQTGGTTQSRLFYGFSINQDWGDAWLINNIPVWRAVQSAFVLQVREEWFAIRRVPKLCSPV